MATIILVRYLYINIKISQVMLSSIANLKYVQLTFSSIFCRELVAYFKVIAKFHGFLRIT